MIRTLLIAAALTLPATALADGEPSDAPVAEAGEAPAKPPTVAEQLHQLRGERTEIMEELSALEEGYSELVDADAKALEARVQGLIDRLEAVDKRIATLSNKR